MLLLLAGCTGDEPAPPPAPATTSAPPTTAAALPEGLKGVPATGGIGVTALLHTTGPTVFDADRGPAGSPPGYPGGDVGMDAVRVGKSVVLIAYARGENVKDPFDVFAYTGPASPPRSLGRAWSVAPGADGESVWAIRQDAPDSCRLQHVKLDGAELGHGQSASCRTQVRGESRHGLLISINADGAESTDALVEPETGRTVQQAPRILAVAGDWMLLDGLTDLTLVDLRDNSRKKLSRPTVGPAPTVVPSREGALFAADFAVHSYRATNTQLRDVWLLRPDALSWEHAPGMPFVTEHLKDGGGMDWTDAGDLVLADGVLAAWHPGEPAWRLGKATLPDGDWGGVTVLP
ncbi:hypothetical protein VA596_09615 [Amycolatopsis sp., V23-08]|uniref:Uncharacterized protein n=1 Tax=Amycolatopsis heterodermiae TaxID=3110235 RepID=A0ABU5R299_9PSEU|nr:hypothetical protein [Amycolatopsis sp., V23-08]MEA5359794.1 hypothetical protein [Amycolatopsis sp., V23-08]